MVIGIVKPKQLKAKGHFEKMACSYITKYILFTCILSDSEIKEERFGVLMIYGES